MESFFSRYKNPLVLMAVLLIQVIGLATQVKRLENGKPGGGTRLIRLWAMSAVTPVERAFVGTGHFFRNTWHNYIDLHGVRKQNRDLQAELDRVRMENARLKEDAEQAHRLHALLGFREKFIAQTVVAQVIGTSGSEQSRVIHIDKGSHAGLRTDMAVLTPDGIVGKVREVTAFSAQVLLINDRDSGAGVILEKSRLQGILKGTMKGELLVSDVMSDEKVEAGEQVITSGGDRIYPKGLPVGTVTSAGIDRDTETFLAIKVKPAANLNRLEEVLVITKMAEETPAVSQDGVRVRAADILAERLPVVPKKPEKPEDKPKTLNGAQPPVAGKTANGAQPSGSPPRAGVVRGGVEVPSAVGKAAGVSAGGGTTKKPADTGKDRGAQPSGPPARAGVQDTVSGAQPPSAAGKAVSPGANAGATKKSPDSGRDRVAQPPSAAGKAVSAGASGGTTKKSADATKKSGDATSPSTMPAAKPKKTPTTKPDQNTGETNPGTATPPDTAEKPPQ